MLRPDPIPMPAAATASSGQIDELDTSCLNCFSRRVGLISLGWIIVVMTTIGVFSTIQLMTVASGGAIAILVVYLLTELVDVVLTSLLLLGLRDGVVRTRLNVWIIWNISYSAVLVVLFLIFLAAIAGVSVAEGVLGGIRLVLVIALRVYACYAGWKFREDIMTAPPSAAQMRPEGGFGH